jgi:hypothetical protein
MFGSVCEGIEKIEIAVVRSCLKIEFDFTIIAVGEDANSRRSLWLASSPTTISKKGTRRIIFKQLLSCCIFYERKTSSEARTVFVMFNHVSYKTDIAFFPSSPESSEKLFTYRSICCRITSSLISCECCFT